MSAAINANAGDACHQVEDDDSTDRDSKFLRIARPQRSLSMATVSAAKKTALRVERGGREKKYGKSRHEA